ncbi:MAG: OB-fold nucleic acid binding domain-containing protein [Candidatus Aenigmatarchaeota archaeon]
MDFEKTVLTFSSISFALGFLLLIYVAYFLNLPELSVSNVTSNFLGEKISVKGKVANIVERDKVSYIILSDGQKNLTIVIFPSVYKEVKNDIKINHTIKVIGILSEYKGNLQIILQNSKNLIIEK